MNIKLNKYDCILFRAGYELKFSAGLIKLFHYWYNPDTKEEYSSEDYNSKDLCKELKLI